MSAAQHTPGPWSLHPIAATSVVGSKGFVVAACGGHSNNMADPDELHDELCANARLVAAAPELLEALESLLFYADGILRVQCAEDGEEVPAVTFPDVRAAIAKATGSQHG